jgi:FixJ family two-component response regulator
MGEHPTILVVDDDPVVNTAVCALLDEIGQEYASAASCAETIALLQSHSFACGIIDLNLPDGNGLSLLPIIAEHNPCFVPIILTGYARADIIVDTMRAGAFDFLVKPVDFATFRAALARALHHYEVTRERDGLLVTLSEERDLLKTRVAEATADLRRHAVRIEQVNARQEVLLQLNRMSEEAYTEEDLFRSLFDKLGRCMPLQCAALTTEHAHEYFIAAMPGENEQVVVVVSEPPVSGPLEDTPTEPVVLHTEICSSVESHTGLNTREWTACVYPQKAFGRVFCNVAFFLPGDYEVDADADAFLGACASVVTSKWQDLRLFHYAAKRACVGNLALDFSRDMVQVLTAVRTAADVVMECGLTAEAAQGMSIIGENVEALRRLLQELRQLSSPQKNTVETVHLDRFVDQSLDLLAGTIESRGIVVDKEFLTSGKCVLFNGAALARTFLDLISSAVRAVENDRRIVLRLKNSEPDAVVFEISYDGLSSELFGVARRVTDRSVPSALGNHPKFVMAQRTVRGCGGTLKVEHKMEGWCAFSVVLPKNALSSSRELGELGLS